MAAPYENLQQPIGAPSPAPHQQAPFQQIPYQQAPGQQAPYQQVPGQQAPYQQAPAQQPPADAPGGPLAAGPVKQGPIDQRDIEGWKNRFNVALNDAAGTINNKSAPDARAWDAGFCGCCAPIDNCLVTWCCPCITFGKTHHRMMKSSTMEGYEPVNTSCLMFFGAGCFGLHWILEAMQRSEIRKKYNVKGSCLTDIAAACCCILCDLTQQEKETRVREKEVGGGQYKVADAMTYEHKA